MKEIEQTNKGRPLRNFLIVGVIVVLIGAVWLFKNQGQEAPPPIDTLAGFSEVNGYFPLDVTETIDLEDLKTYGLPIIIDFGSDSCGPCVEMAPALKTLNEEMAGKAIILFADVYKYQETMEGFPIQVIPTQVFIDAEGNPYQPGENASVQYIQYTYRETGELAFTVHQGTITEEQLREALLEMGAQSGD